MSLGFIAWIGRHGMGSVGSVVVGFLRHGVGSTYLGVGAVVELQSSGWACVLLYAFCGVGPVGSFDM